MPSIDSNATVRAKRASGESGSDSRSHEASEENAQLHRRNGSSGAHSEPTGHHDLDAPATAPLSGTSAMKKVDKGKKRATYTTEDWSEDNGPGPIDERQPLLNPGSGRSRRHAATVSDDQTGSKNFPRKGRHNLSSTLLNVLIVVLTLLFAAILFLTLLIFSFVPSNAEIKSLSNIGEPGAAAYYSQPDIQILNITEDGVWVDVGVTVGVDKDAILGIQRRDRGKAHGVEATFRGHGAPWWERLRAKVAERIWASVGDLKVEIPNDVDIYATAPHCSDQKALSDSSVDSLSDRILKTYLPAPIILQLHTAAEPRVSSSGNAVEDGRWILENGQEIRMQLRLKPVANSKDLLTIGQEAWNSGKVVIQAKTSTVDVALVSATTSRKLRSSLKQHGSDGLNQVEEEKSVSWWRRLTRKRVTNVAMAKEVKLSEIPGMPDERTNITEIVQLERYSLRTIEPRGAVLKNSTGHVPKLEVSAVAAVKNLARDFYVNWPYGIGFEVLLPLNQSRPSDETPSSHLSASSRLNSTSDGWLKMADVATLPLNLHGQKSLQVEIAGLVEPDFGRVDGATETFNHFLANYLHARPNTVVVRGSRMLPDLKHPVPEPPTWISDILPYLNVTMEFPSPEEAPDLLKSVTIEDMRIGENDGDMVASGTVRAIVELPDELRNVQVNVTGVWPDILVIDGPPGKSNQEVDPSHPPYPARAFGRIHPVEIVAAHSDVDPTDSSHLLVTAPIENVPLKVLEGRNGVLSEFITKVILRGGALAGIQGIATVRLQLRGITGDLQVDGLPVVGEVVVGRPR